MFIQENAFENVVCEMAPILSRPLCVKPLLCEIIRVDYLSQMTIVCNIKDWAIQSTKTAEDDRYDLITKFVL